MKKLANDELPEGWLPCSLGDVIDYGKTTKAEPWEIEDSDWILELEDIEKDTSRLLERRTFAERQSKSTKNRFEVGDVLYGKLRPYLNKVIIADLPGYCTTEIIPLRPNTALEGRYLFAWLKHPVFLDYVSNVSHGLNMPRLGTDAGKAAPFVLAPKGEQKRIADKLEAVLARVDASRTRLDRVTDILKRFRQSVLAAATSGQLTVDWRAKAGVTIDEWNQTFFEEVCREITVGFVGKMSDAYRESGIPFLRSQNVRPFRFDKQELKFVSPEFHKTIKKSALAPGDVVVVRTGAPGQCCVIPPELPEANCSDLVIVRPGPELSPHFAVIFINSETSQDFVKAERVGVAQSHFNVGSMKRAPVHLPSIFEQNEIVRRVEVLFACADQIEARLSSAQNTVERLAPAVLSKAFRGHLVPQDPNDEPASVLLARIRLATKKPAKLVVPRHVKAQPEANKSRMKKLREVLASENNWITAQEAFRRCGVADGSNTLELELLYAELRELDRVGQLRVEVERDSNGTKIADRLKLRTAA